MTRFLYSVQQRVIAADCELPFLTPLSGQPPADIHLTLTRQIDAPASQPWYRSDDREDATLIERAADQYVVRFADGTVFVVDANGREITLASRPSLYGVADLAAYALGPLLAFALHLQGHVLLHASAVVMRQRVVLFCGPSGSGKSTTAALLGQQGFTIAADDIASITPEPPHQLLPSGGVLRLWSDSVEMLYGDPLALPTFAPSWEKRVVALEANAPSHPIAAVLLLDGRRAHEPQLTLLPPKTAWSRLMAQGFTAKLPDHRMAPAIFAAIASIADTVSVYTFTPPEIPRTNALGQWLESALETVLA